MHNAFRPLHNRRGQAGLYSRLASYVFPVKTVWCPVGILLSAGQPVSCWRRFRFCLFFWLCELTGGRSECHRETAASPTSNPQLARKRNLNAKTSLKRVFFSCCFYVIANIRPWAELP